MDVLSVWNWSYIPEVPTDIDHARKLLLNYAHISPGDIDEHLMRIREQAWAIARFPCIGRWRFLYLTDPNDPVYQQVLFRLTLPKTKDALLDLGCGLGQVLREFRADGVPGERLFGTDGDAKLMDIGYDLFRDKDRLGAKFVTADIFDPSKKLDELLRKVTIIHATSFFHLFSWAQQVYICNRIVRCLRSGVRNALIYGKQVGKLEPAPVQPSDNNPYLHNLASLQKLWNEVGVATKTKWIVELDFTGDGSAMAPGHGKDVQPFSFFIYQI